VLLSFICNAMQHTYIGVVLAMLLHRGLSDSVLTSYFLATSVGGGHGDGGPATSAALKYAHAAAYDSCGNLLIAESDGQAIRRVSPTGIISTIAGNREPGFDGDGRPANASMLNRPYGVAVDNDDNILIADTSNCRIRKVWANGTIITIAGNGTVAFGGDGDLATRAAINSPYWVASGPSGTVLFSDSFNNRVRQILANGTIVTIAGDGTHGYAGDGGFAIAASLSHPYGVTPINGSVFVADMDNHRIRQIWPNGTISTFAGNGSGFNGGDGGPAMYSSVDSPYSIVFDAQGAAYISHNNGIRKVTAQGFIFTIAGTGETAYSGDGGLALTAAMWYPTCVLLDHMQQVVVVDTWNHRIRRISSPSGVITTIAGTGSTVQASFMGGNAPATSVVLGQPSDIAFDLEGNAHIADAAAGVVIRLSVSGIASVVAGNGSTGGGGDGGPATLASVSPNSIVFNSQGDMFIADTYNHRVRRVFPNGTIRNFAGDGVPRFRGDGGFASLASLWSPWRVAVDTTQALLICDTWNHRIRKVWANGTITTVVGKGTAGYSGDGASAMFALINFPSSVDVDLTGNMVIADTSNNVVRMVYANGSIVTIAGRGQASFSGDGAAATLATLNEPRQAVFDTQGNIYIADSSNHRIRAVSSIDGLISTVAGNGSNGFTNDGKLATQTSLYSPYGIRVDLLGYLHISDTMNQRVRVAVPLKRHPATLSSNALVVGPDGGLVLSLVVSTLQYVATAITSLAVGQYTCSSLVVVNDSAVMCNSWASPELVGCVDRLLLTWTAFALNFTAAANMTLFHAPLLVDVNPSDGAEGSRIWLRYTECAPFSTTLRVLLNGVWDCIQPYIISSGWLQCTLPAIPTSAYGYPMLSIAVMNEYGQSNGAWYVEYPTAVVAQFVPSVTCVQTWPSASSDPFNSTAAIFVTAGGKGQLSCTAFAYSCLLPIVPGAGAPVPPALVGVTTTMGVVPSNGTSTMLTFDALSLNGPSGTICNISAVCRDSKGEAATATWAGKPPCIATPNFSIAWYNTSLSIVQPPGLLPSVSAIWSVLTTAAALPTLGSSALSSMLNCLSMLLTIEPSSSMPLTHITAALSSVVPSFTSTSPTSLLINVSGLDASAVPLGSSAEIHTECVWVPTNERMRLTPITVTIPNATVTLAPNLASIYAYELFAGWTATAQLLSSPTSSMVGTCVWQLVNAT
jgi:hypothetical protein